MKVYQAVISDPKQIENEFKKFDEIKPSLILMFGSQAFFQDKTFRSKLAKRYPEAQVVGCSTAGEISENGVSTNKCVISALHFSKSKIKVAVSAIGGIQNSKEAGKKIGESLNTKDLSHVLLLCPGLNINGSAVIEGLKEKVSDKIAITGGLAGDNENFSKTYTSFGEDLYEDSIIALGFYGPSVQFGYGSVGGWEPFGQFRKVTKSVGSELFELDGKPALEVYKTYLGDRVKDLPASALLFPFALLKDEKDPVGLIRTILSIDEKKGSMVLAGDIPQGITVRLMHAIPSGLANGAKQAAENSLVTLHQKPEENSFALLVSCVGRKLVMGVDIDEEVEVIQDKLKGIVVGGFYSYGEICPMKTVEDCKLHNQTMTITLITEKAS